MDTQRVLFDEFKDYIYGLARGGHHPKSCALFFVFAADLEGVDVPDGLPKMHGRYVTLCLQHQFWDVTADNLGFSITLNFNRQPYKVRVTWRSVIHCYTTGAPLAKGPLPVPANTEDPKVVRVDFQTRRVLP